MGHISREVMKKMSSVEKIEKTVCPSQRSAPCTLEILGIHYALISWSEYSKILMLHILIKLRSHSFTRSGLALGEHIPIFFTGEKDMARSCSQLWPIIGDAKALPVIFRNFVSFGANYEYQNWKHDLARLCFMLYSPIFRKFWKLRN